MMSFEKDDDQDDDHRRNIDAAEIGQQIADRPQDRFGDPIEEIPSKATTDCAD